MGESRRALRQVAAIIFITCVAAAGCSQVDSGSPQSPIAPSPTGQAVLPVQPPWVGCQASWNVSGSWVFEVKRLDGKTPFTERFSTIVNQDNCQQLSFLNPDSLFVRLSTQGGMKDRPYIGYQVEASSPQEPGDPCRASWTGQVTLETAAAAIDGIVSVTEEDCSHYRLSLKGHRVSS